MISKFALLNQAGGEKINDDKSSALDLNNIIDLAEGMLHSPRPYAAVTVDGYLKTCNLAFNKLTGYSNDELRDLDLSCTVLSKCWNSLTNIPPSATDRWDADVTEANLICKDGNEIPVLIQSALSSSREKPLYYLYLKPLLEGPPIDEFESRKLLKQITDTMMDLFCVCSPSGSFQYISPSHYNLLGYTSEALLSHNLLDLVHPQDRSAMSSGISHLLKQSAWEKIEYRFRNAQGQYLWLESVANVIERNETVLGLVFWSRDVTRRKHAEQELQQQINILQHLIDNIPSPIYYKDKSGIYQGYNKAYADALGFPRSDAVGKTVYDLFPEDLARFYEKKDRELLENPGTQIYESSIVFWGKPRNVIFTKATLTNLQGEIAGLVGVIIDITERKQMEQQITRSEKELRQKVQYFNTLLDNMNELFYSYDSQGILTYANRKTCELMGFECQKKIGHHVLEIIPFEYWEEAGPEIAERLQYGKSDTSERIIRSPEGVSRLIRFNNSPIIENNTIIGGMVVGEDITEHREMEKEMVRLDRLRVVGEMAAGIAHEIRNPMTAVRGFLQMLIENNDFKDYKSYFDTMIEELDRANSIINEFLSLAKNKEINLTRQNLNNIIKAIYPLLAADAMKTDKFIILNLQEVPDLLLDNEEIRQLILNLVRNGLEAMPPRSYLTVRTYRENNVVIMAVIDEGIGLKPGVLDKIGTPFFTTKEQGTGLGLAICYSIAARHNAVIDVETSTSGTIFYVRFSLHG